MTMLSTSKEIKNIFTLAKEKCTMNNISLIVFDDLGITEKSPNNPLKIIHDEIDEALEEQNINDNYIKIAFVGISNRNLDPNLMDKGICLSNPELLSYESIRNTAYSIAKSYDKITAEFLETSLFSRLDHAYYRYKDYLLKNQKRLYDFHGIIDFYHLIKYITFKFGKDERNHEEIIFASLEKNFGGLKLIEENSNITNTSIKIIKTFYSDKQCENNYDVLGRIKENILDRENRHLLIISNSAASIFLISIILKEINKDYILYLGSPFIKDQASKEYHLKTLNKIRLLKEQEEVLILKNLGSIYLSLYDLFELDLDLIDNKNYSTMNVGSSNNKYSRFILSFNTEELEQKEAPFLNRFEKHIVSFEYILAPDLVKESFNILQKLKEIITLNKYIFKGINYGLEKICINFDIEEIQGIMYHSKQKGLKKEQMLEQVISKISLTSLRILFFV